MPKNGALILLGWLLKLPNTKMGMPKNGALIRLVLLLNLPNTKWHAQKTVHLYYWGGS